MKYILSLFLVCASYTSFSQITVSDMIKVYNMDFDQFETFSILKGFELNEIQNNKQKSGHVYVKGVDENTKYLSLHTNHYGFKKVCYQTSNSIEYLTIKDELKSKGFTLISTDNFNGDIIKTFKLNEWEFRVFRTNNNGIVYEMRLSQQQ